MEIILIALVLWYMGSTLQKITRAIDSWVDYYVTKESERLSRED